MIDSGGVLGEGSGAGDRLRLKADSCGVALFPFRRPDKPYSTPMLLGPFRGFLRVFTRTTFLSRIF